MSSMYYIQGLEFINDSSQNLRPPNLKTVHGTVIRNHTQNLEMLSDSVTGLGTKPGLSRLGAKPWHARETGHGLGRSQVYKGQIAPTRISVVVEHTTSSQTVESIADIPSTLNNGR